MPERSGSREGGGREVSRENTKNKKETAAEKMAAMCMEKQQKMTARGREK